MGSRKKTTVGEGMCEEVGWEEKKRGKGSMMEKGMK
jgi:hypothetical protein